ncbi:MAG: hypothetical protein GWN14_02375, partial [candidate division Zixibacteria bacterium]|nr:hypothetical protein [Gammaproteobacteria bacterium]NIX54793.1 hypothetical protein [candidate division Zixibacteria bacterium]
NTETGTQVWGEAWIDPNDTTSAEAQQEVRRGEFRVMEEDIDYIVIRDLGYIQLEINLQENEIL